MVPLKIKMDQDFDIKTKEVHVFDLFSLQYQQRASVTDFYNQFRSLVIASLKKKGDVITWQDNAVMSEDEQLSPTFEELILGVVLSLIDTRLPGHVKNEFCQSLKKEQSLMDYRMDILSKAPAFLTQMKANLLAIPKSDEDLFDRYLGFLIAYRYRQFG